VEPILAAKDAVARLVLALSEPLSEQMRLDGWTDVGRVGLLEALERAQPDLAAGDLGALSGLRRSMDYRGSTAI
jgi:hypothetical protein